MNFENTIIVMTSNAGSATKEGTVGFGRSANEQDADRAMKALQQFLRPEFINRVDAVIDVYKRQPWDSPCRTPWICWTVCAGTVWTCLWMH